MSISVLDIDDVARDMGVISCPEPSPLPRISGFGWNWGHDAATAGSSCGNSSLVLSPSITGKARRFDVSWSGFGGERFSISFGDGNLDSTDTHFTYDTWFYSTDLSHVDQLEFDLNQVMPDGRTVIFGMQFNFNAGFVQYTRNNSGSAQWVSSSVPCSRPSVNTWHHFIFKYHRDSNGNVTYDSVTVDGVLSAIGQTVSSAFSLGWNPIGVLVLNFQVGGDNSANSTICYLDKTNITGGTVAQGAVPALVLIQMTSGGNIWFDPASRYDGSNLHLFASDGGVTGFAEILSAATKEIVVFPTPGQPFEVTHGLGGKPALVQVQMTSPGEIWFQDAEWDETKVYLVASDEDSAITARIIIWLTSPILAGSQFGQVDIDASLAADFTAFDIPHGFTTRPAIVLFNQKSAGRLWFQPTGPISVSAKRSGGAGYAAGDAGTVSGGNGDATYEVDTVDDGGAVLTYHLTAAGTGYGTVNGNATATTSGTGNGAFTIDIKGGRYDLTNLKLSASASDVKAKALVWA